MITHNKIHCEHLGRYTTLSNWKIKKQFKNQAKNLSHWKQHYYTAGAKPHCMNTCLLELSILIPK